MPLPHWNLDSKESQESACICNAQTMLYLARSSCSYCRPATQGQFQYPFLTSENVQRRSSSLKRAKPLALCPRSADRGTAVHPGSPDVEKRNWQPGKCKRSRSILSQWLGVSCSPNFCERTCSNASFTKSSDVESLLNSPQNLCQHICKGHICQISRCGVLHSWIEWYLNDSVWSRQSL